MLRAIGQLKKNDGIIITRPDKGSGVVVMDKSEYVRLLKEASINDETNCFNFEGFSTNRWMELPWVLLLDR